MKKDFTFLPSCFLTVLVLYILSSLLFLLKQSDFSLPTLLVLIPSIFVYPFLELLPSILLSAGSVFFTRKMISWTKRAWITGIIMFITVFPVHLFLLSDAGLYFRYGYHFNFHVLNIFTTPGGFEGMGLSPYEIFSLAAGLLLLAIFHAGLIFCFFRFEKLSFLKIKSPFYYIIPPVVCGLLLATSILSYAYSHYTMNPAPLMASKSIPFFIPATAGSFFKSLGVKKPSREAVILKLASKNHIGNYPQNPIKRDQSKNKKYNIVWLACESWAARLYSEEIMPQTAKFAAKGITFKNHFSGGNVTRQGMFSMFYSIPGSYWHSFLAARKGPLFIDWLKEDDYNFHCITSSKFSYPEFDQTIFFAVPSEKLHSDSKGATFERDQRNLKLLLRSIEEAASTGKPFMRFMFFESTHHPYAFPEEATLYKDYLESFNIVQTTAKDAPAIFRRAANSARHLDMCLGQVFDLLEKKDLLKNTIVVVAGDHGEEYYEKGRLGHSSAFNNEQTKTTFILYYPGITPGTYDKMSSHMDIVPILAKFFGVSNPSSDYSCGFDLLSPEKPERRYSLIADWDRVFFAGTKYKSLIPLDAHSVAAQVITDADDKELPDVKPFYKEYGKDLIKVQQDLTVFTRQK